MLLLLKAAAQAAVTPKLEVILKMALQAAGQVVMQLLKVGLPELELQIKVLLVD
jgi:hypothetical protein